MSKRDENWGRARKKPVEISFRKPREPKEIIATEEGMMTAIPGKHYVIEGVRGEPYPIDIEIFRETYDVTEPLREGEP